jgi:hypothetical protein
MVVLGYCLLLVAMVHASQGWPEDVVHCTIAVEPLGQESRRRDGYRAVVTDK